MLTATERTIRARIGALSLHAAYDSRETTARARATFLKGFELQVDPDGSLAPAERQRRAEYARKAHFTKLALASARKRSGAKTTAVDQTAAVEIVAGGMVDASDQLQPVV